MSPRSSEFLEAARRHLAGARAVVGNEPSIALSAAYYAMLYAARAALSERDVSSKTHRGTWHEFRRAFVETDEFPAELAAAAHRTQPEREQASYEAWDTPAEEAQRVIDLAERFVAAVERLVD